MENLSIVVHSTTTNCTENIINKKFSYTSIYDNVLVIIFSGDFFQYFCIGLPRASQE